MPASAIGDLESTIGIIILQSDRSRAGDTTIPTCVIKEAGLVDMKTLSNRVASSLLLLLVVAQIAFAEGPPKATPRRGDIKYIQCALCEHLAKHAWRSGRALLKTSTVSKKASFVVAVNTAGSMIARYRDEGFATDLALGAA